VQRGIDRYDGTITPAGRRLDVQIPAKTRQPKNQSGSQSSQHPQPNDPDRNSSRYPPKNPAQPRRDNRARPTSDFVKSQAASSDAEGNHSEAQSPLTPGFQPQLMGPPSSAMSIPAEQLRSSLSEVHQSAMDRLALESISNLSFKDRNVNRSPHEKPQVNKKENYPLKDESSNATPAATSEEEQPDIYSGETSQVGNITKKVLMLNR
jgi:hypothetical protein